VRRERAWPWISTAARIGLAAVWIVAGVLKAGDLAASGRAVNAYQLMPYEAARVVGAVQPFLEIGLGLLLLAGLAVRLSAGLSAVLLTVFIAGIVSAWARGLQIDCGCFGGGGYDPDASSQYPWEIARDAALLLASLFLVRWPRTRLALDTRLFRPLTTVS
jgi:uncharacterized membrane protein YphA (DoxX/SURF4 family)